MLLNTKYIPLFFFAFVTATGWIQPTPAQAGFYIVGNRDTAKKLGGAALAFAALPLGVVLFYQARLHTNGGPWYPNGNDTVGMIVGMGVAATTGVVGAAALGTATLAAPDHSFAFRAIPVEAAKGLGLSEEEVESFNEHLAQIDLLSEEVSEALGYREFTLDEAIDTWKRVASSFRGGTQNLPKSALKTLGLVSRAFVDDYFHLQQKNK